MVLARNNSIFTGSSALAHQSDQSKYLRYVSIFSIIATAYCGLCACYLKHGWDNNFYSLQGYN